MDPEAFETALENAQQRPPGARRFNPFAEPAPGIPPPSQARPPASAGGREAGSSAEPDSIFGPRVVDADDPLERDTRDPKSLSMRVRLEDEARDNIFGPVVKSAYMPFSRRMQAAFLEQLRSHAIVALAVRNLRLDREEVYRMRFQDDAFRQEWDAAVLLGIEAQEDEIARRAFHGVDKPIFYLGQQVATVKEYSDQLAMFILKGAKPEKYRERYDVTGKQEIDLKLQNASDEELNKMILEGLSRVGVRVRPRDVIDVEPEK